MLKIVSVQGTLEQRLLFQQHLELSCQPQAIPDLWVVADLEAKLLLQGELLDSTKIIGGDGIVRASELWRRLIFRARPELQLVAPEFVRLWLAHYLRNQAPSWAKSSGVAQMLNNYLNQLAPILAHPEGQSQLLRWLNEKSDSRERWGKWFELAAEVWPQILAQGWISEQWAIALLVNENNLHRLWSEPLTFDLGPNILHLECELILRLAKGVSVTVIEPRPARQDLSSSSAQQALWPYEILRPHGKRESPEPVLATASLSCRRFATKLSEVKFACDQLRRWHQAGVAAEDMAVLAPLPQQYEPVLRAYLHEEGLTLAGRESTPLHSFVEVARYLAHLRVRSGRLTSQDLELTSFAQDGLAPLTFDRFRQLYANIFESDDLFRHPGVAAQYKQDLKGDGAISRDQFLAWALESWPSSGASDRLRGLMQRFFDESLAPVFLGLREWVELLEHLAAKIELPLTEAVDSGIRLVRLNSAHCLKASHLVVLGLSEEALAHSELTHIDSRDWLSIASGMGFYLCSSHSSQNEFAARWLLEAPGTETVACLAGHDFSGGVLAPSLVWLRQALKTGSQAHLTAAPLTARDRRQRAKLMDLVQGQWAGDKQILLMLSRVQNDLGVESCGPVNLARPLRLSASTLERYLACPFVVLAEKGFGLVDVEELDFDLDPRARGRLVHSLLETIALNGPPSAWTSPRIETLIEEVRRREQLEMADERLWPMLRRRLLRLIERFVERETYNQNQFSLVKTLAAELKIEAQLWPDGSLRRSPGEGSFRFVGKIDRVDGVLNADGSPAAAVVYDYKQSKASDKIAPADRWLDRHSLQLGLYAMALEAGVVRDSQSEQFWEPVEVAGAFFYILKDMSCETGLRLAPFQGELYPARPRAKSMDREQKHKLFVAMQDLLADSANRLGAGHYQARPHSPDECYKCQWSFLCRAPHLN